VYAAASLRTSAAAHCNRIAALDAVTGQATAFNPNANGTVTALALWAQTLLPPELHHYRRQARRGLAALDPATDWQRVGMLPATAKLYALNMFESALYVVGAFTTIGGQPRNNLAALDAGYRLGYSLGPERGGSVLALGVSCMTLYAGGAFATMAGVDALTSPVSISGL